MQVAVLLFASILVVSCFLLPPGIIPLPSPGRIPSTPGVPVASQPAAICSVYCHMLHMQSLCNQMQPTGSQMHPPDVQYQPLCYPVANQTAPYAAFSAICCICSACAAHRQPNTPLRRQISAPRQPCGQPASGHMQRILQYGCI